MNDPILPTEAHIAEAYRVAPIDCPVGAIMRIAYALAAAEAHGFKRGHDISPDDLLTTPQYIPGTALGGDLLAPYVPLEIRVGNEWARPATLLRGGTYGGRYEVVYRYRGALCEGAALASNLRLDLCRPEVRRKIVDVLRAGKRCPCGGESVATAAGSDECGLCWGGESRLGWLRQPYPDFLASADVNTLAEVIDRLDQGLPPFP